MKKYFGKYENEAAMKNAVASGELSSPFVAYTEDNDAIHFNDYFYAEVTIDKTSVSPDGGSATVSINASEDVGSWSAVCSSEFVTFAPASGTSGESQVVFTFEANESDDRVATLRIVFYDSFGQLVTYSEFNVSQGKKISPKESPLTLEFLSSGNVNFYGFEVALTTNFDVECNINGGGWNSTSLYSSEGIDVVSGDTIQLRGGSINNKGYSTRSTAVTPYIVSTADFNAFGNVYSMISPENFAQVTNPSAKINQIFGYCSTLKSAENLYMGESGTRMVSNQFTSFFRGSGIEKAPALPMANLLTSCYENMFNGCTALTDSPVISANDVRSTQCLKGMFSGCTSLSAVTCTATSVNPSTSSTSPSYNWVKDVAANGTFTKATDVGWLTDSPHGIPSGWSVVEV